MLCGLPGMRLTSGAAAVGYALQGEEVQSVSTSNREATGARAGRPEPEEEEEEEKEEEKEEEVRLASAAMSANCLLRTRRHRAVPRPTAGAWALQDAPLYSTGRGYLLSYYSHNTRVVPIM